MLRGEAVGCITEPEESQLLGQIAGLKVGDFDGNLVLKSHDKITEEQVSRLHALGIAGEVYSERLGMETRYRLGTYWTRQLIQEEELEAEEAPVEEPRTIY